MTHDYDDLLDRLFDIDDWDYGYDDFDIDDIADDLIEDELEYVENEFEVYLQ